MALDLTTILNTTHAQMAGGELLIYEDGVHISLGHVTAVGIALTPEGDAYFAALDTVAKGNAEAEVSAVIAEAATEQANDDAQAAVDAANTAPDLITAADVAPVDAGQAITVSIADQAALAEALS